MQFCFIHVQYAPHYQCTHFFFGSTAVFFAAFFGVVDIIVVAISIAIDDNDANILIARISDLCPIKFNMLVMHERNVFFAIFVQLNEAIPAYNFI